MYLCCKRIEFFKCAYKNIIIIIIIILMKNLALKMISAQVEQTSTQRLKD